MNEEVEFCLSVAEEKMQKAIQHLEKELAKIRAGKASPQMLDGVSVDYYGTPTPLNQVSNVSAADSRTIQIQPWEKAMIGPIEKAIINANLGMNPDNNGELIRINIPALTEERRKDLVKQVKHEGENGKIGVRNARRDANDELKKLKKDGVSEDIIKDAEDNIQKLTDKYVAIVDKELEHKEADILTV